MAGSHGDGGTNAVQMCSQGKSARSEKQLFSFFPARAVGRQHHKCRALSTQGLPVRKPKVCAELADLRRGFHRVLRRQSPCSNTHMCKEEPWLGSVPSSGSRIIREPGCAPAWREQRLPFGGPQYPFGILCLGWLPGREQPGQLQGHTGHCCSTSQPCLCAECNSGGTMASAAPAQSRPDIAKNKFYRPAHGFLGYQHGSHVSPGDLRPLGHARVDLVGFGKGRGAAPAALCREDSCLGWEEAGRAACAGRPSVSHHSSSFLLHGLTAPELPVLPKVCPLPILLCWLAGITLFLCSLSEQQQHLSPCCQNQHEGKGKNRVQTKVPKS